MLLPSESGVLRRMNRSFRRGRWAEQQVLLRLQSRGWSLLTRNWRCRWGEMDLLVHKSGRLLLVEVKARQQRGLDAWGSQALTSRQRSCLARTFCCWLAVNTRYQACSLECRLDMVRLQSDPLRISWLPLDVLHLPEQH